MRKLILILFLLSGMAFAGRVGLVVQFSENEVMTSCVTIPIDGTVKAGCNIDPLTFCNGEVGDSTAERVLINSGLGAVMGGEYIAYPGCSYGRLLCKIGSVGCDASGSNCVGCGSNYWSFSYLSGGSWQYSECGISSFNARDGDVLGFIWGTYGDTLEFHSFSEICPSSNSQGGGGRPIRYFAISTDGNCSKKPFMINVKEKMGGAIWEPTAFVLSGNLGDIRFENGVGIKVLLHQIYSGKDTGFEKIAVLFTDKKGNTNFIPEKPGRYRLEFGKEGFLGEEREIEINECNEPVVVNKSVEEFKSEDREVEPNITRVDIISPPTAMVNSTVVLRLISETGKPLAHESIVVEFSGGRKELVTNESGEAAFPAGIEGVYSYSSPNHTLSAYRVTNVIEPTKIEFDEIAPPVIQSEETAPSVGMAVANPLQNTLLALVVGVIALVLLFTLTKARK